jgi:hypothetical protein
MGRILQHVSGNFVGVFFKSQDGYPSVKERSYPGNSYEVYIEKQMMPYEDSPIAPL